MRWTLLVTRIVYNQISISTLIHIWVLVIQQYHQTKQEIQVLYAACTVTFICKKMAVVEPVRCSYDILLFNVLLWEWEVVIFMCIWSGRDKTHFPQKDCFVFQLQGHDSSLSSSAASSEGGNTPCNISLLERLIRSHPVWFLPGIQRAGAFHLLQGKEEGVRVCTEYYAVLFLKPLCSSCMPLNKTKQSL
jgi:hypothetical protein